MREDAVPKQGVDSPSMKRRSSQPVLASVWTMKLAACRCAGRYSVICSTRLRSCAPLEHLALSPQCGFSSTVHGNNIAVDHQRRQLALVVETAAEVWG